MSHKRQLSTTDGIGRKQKSKKRIGDIQQEMTTALFGGETIGARVHTRRAILVGETATTEKDSEKKEIWTKGKLIRLAQRVNYELLKKEGARLVMATNVPAEPFLEFRCSEHQITKKSKCHLLEGKMIFVELPSSVHGVSIIEIGGQLRDWTKANNLNFNCYTSVTYVVGHNSILEPDVSGRPVNRNRPPPGLGANQSGEAYPTIVFEIGVSESLVQLHELAIYYFSSRTTIRVYIAIKIWNKRNDGTVAMMALLYRRVNFNSNQQQQPQPDAAVSFGTAPPHGNAKVDEVTNHPSGVGYGSPDCNGPNLQPYQIRVPAMDLFHDTPGGVPSGTSHFVLDLYNVQQKVFQQL